MKSKEQIEEMISKIKTCNENLRKRITENTSSKDTQDFANYIILNERGIQALEWVIFWRKDETISDNTLLE